MTTGGDQWSLTTTTTVRLNHFRLIRVRVSFGTNIGNYPYDHQATEIKIASLDNTIDLVKVVTAQWNGLHNVRANITNVNRDTLG